MTKLSMRFGGDKKVSHDFSHLENNPNYKPETVETAGEQPPAEPQEIQEPVDTVVQNEPVVEQTPVEVQEPTEPAVQDEPTKVIDNKNLELTDEMFFSTLSERLGYEVNDLGQLKQEQVELDPQVAAINEWRQKTGRPIEDFFKYQKNYDEVSDIDVAREYLQLEYPTFSEQEINDELKLFITSEDDLDEDISRKNRELKKYAVKGRKHLNSLKQDLGTPSNNFMTDEAVQKLQMYDQIQEQITQGETQRTDYVNGLNNAASSINSISLKLSDDMVIDYNVIEQDKGTISEYISNIPHWTGEDGNLNHQAIVSDGYKIKYFDKIVQMVYEQGLNSGKDEIIKEQKNTTLDKDLTSNPQQTGSKKPKYEGLNLGKSKMTVRKF